MHLTDTEEADKLNPTMDGRRPACRPRRTSCFPHLSQDATVPLEPEKFHGREIVAKGASPQGRASSVSLPGILRASGEPDGGALLFRPCPLPQGQTRAGGDMR